MVNQEYPINCARCGSQIDSEDGVNDHLQACRGIIPTLESIGKKHDQEKLRFDLIPPIALKALAAILTIGAAKYKENSWQNLENFNDRYTAALMHHLNAWRSGEKNDLESGLPHLWHALCNVVFLIWKEDQEHRCTSGACIGCSGYAKPDHCDKRYHSGSCAILLLKKE